MIGAIECVRVVPLEGWPGALRVDVFPPGQPECGSLYLDTDAAYAVARLLIPDGPDVAVTEGPGGDHVRYVRSSGAER